MPALIPPSSINDARTKALMGLIGRQDAIDLSPLLVYVVSNAPESVLPFLAWQFDVLSPWWQMLSGAASQRALIQQAVPLHKFKGTPYAIKQIINALGYLPPSIQEGQASWGGSAYPSDQGWAVFRVRVPKWQTTGEMAAASVDAVTNIDTLDDWDTLTSQNLFSVPVTGAQQTQLLSAIDFFKPQRSVLDALQFVELPITEQIAFVRDVVDLGLGPIIAEPAINLSDFVVTGGWNIVDVKTVVPIADGHFYASGDLFAEDVAAEPSVVDSGLVINGRGVPSWQN